MSCLRTSGADKPAIQPGGLEGGVGLEVVRDKIADVLEEVGQVELGRLAAAGGEVVHAGDAGVQLMQGLAKGVASPAELPFGLPLAQAERLDRFRHERAAAGHRGTPPPFSSTRHTSLRSVPFRHLLRVEVATIVGTVLADARGAAGLDGPRDPPGRRRSVVRPGIDPRGWGPRRPLGGVDSWPCGLCPGLLRRADCPPPGRQGIRWSG